MVSKVLACVIVICVKHVMQNIMRVAMWSAKFPMRPPPVLLAIHGLDQPLLRQALGAKWGSHAMSRLVNMPIMFATTNRPDKSTCMVVMVTHVDLASKLVQHHHTLLTWQVDLAINLSRHVNMAFELSCMNDMQSWPI